MDKHTLPRTPPIAVGRTAELYTWRDGQVLKLFHPGWGEAAAQYEAAKAEAVHAAGLPAPAIGGVVQVDGRYGILMQRVNGTSLFKIIQGKPWALVSSAQLLADLQLQVHQRLVPSLPSLKDRLSRRIHDISGLPDPVRLAALETLAALPEGEAVCHGDFHPDNIVITDRGPVILDWMDATRGHPLADVARTSFLLAKAALPPGLPRRRLIELIRTLVHKAYLRRYFANQAYDPDHWQLWQRVVWAARLAEDIPQERERLIKLITAEFSQV